jgi:putative nucleotidyltransferase with HDIG domain
MLESGYTVMDGQGFSESKTMKRSCKLAGKSDKALNILLVDDEKYIREALEQYFNSTDHHRISAAASGEEALNLFYPGRFDCAFLDLKMPGMNGLELLKLLKEKDKSLPVVIMTGYPSLDAAVDTMRKGANDFLVKPFSLKQVTATLERVLREQKLLKENLHLNEQLKQQQEIKSLNFELKRRIKQQNVIHQISESADRLNTSEEIYQGMADMTAGFLDVEKAAVILLDRTTEQLLVIAASGFSPKVLGRVLEVYGKGVAGKVAQEGEPMVGRPGKDPQIDALLPARNIYLCMPIKIRGEVFGVLLAADKKGALSFSAEDIFVARFLLDKSALNIENIALYESMVTGLHSTLGALVSAMEAKDPYTRQHSRRVTHFSVLTAQVMGMDAAQVESIRFAAYLHDIGKIGISDSILHKETSLTSAEYEHIKQHPVIGGQIVQDMDLDSQEKAIIRHHHERWDGKGYPDGLSGTDIPLLARVVAVADAFDAMTTDRPYRKAKTQEEAVIELISCSGQQFDRVVVDAFRQMLDRYHPQKPK